MEELRVPTPPIFTPITPATTAQPAKTYSAKFLIKSAVIFLLTFGFALSTGGIILAFVKENNFFVPNSTLSLLYIATLLGLLYAHAWSIGSWDSRVKYYLVPFPIVAGIFFNFAVINYLHAFLFCTAAYLLICYYLYNANKFRRLLVRFIPRMIFTVASRGLILVFSLSAGFMVYINSTVGANTIDVGQQLGSVVKTYLPYFGSTQGIAQDMGISISDLVTSQVNSLIAPYKSFVSPVMALIAMGLFQFLGWITLAFFTSTISLTFFVLRKFGFFKQEFVDVKQEVLSI